MRMKRMLREALARDLYDARIYAATRGRKIEALYSVRTVGDARRAYKSLGWHGAFHIGVCLEKIRQGGTGAPNEVTPINGAEREWAKHRYILWFGEGSPRRLMVWANSLEDALDECGDWLAEHAPGLLADEQVRDAFDDALAEALEEGLPDDETTRGNAQEAAEVDVTVLDSGHYINSWEWGILAEDPTRKDILEIQGRLR